MSHDDLRELSGGYALGALSDADRRAFEAHLSTCAACAGEVRELVAVASGLAHAVPQVDPPAALRARVLSAATAGHRPDAAPAPPSSTRRSGLFAMLSAAAAIAAIALGLYAVSLQQRIRVLEEELRIASTRATEINRQLVHTACVGSCAADSRDSRRTRSPSHRSCGTEDGAGRVRPRLLEPNAGHGSRLRQVAGDNNRSCLSALGDSARRQPGQCGSSRAAIRRNSDPLGAPGASPRVGTVAVTLEPAGGVPAPTGDMIVAGTLSN